MYKMAPLKYSTIQDIKAFTLIVLRNYNSITFTGLMLPFTLLESIKQNGRKFHFVRQNGIRQNSMTPSFGGPDISELYCFTEFVL